jgi:hypothetical protein
MVELPKRQDFIDSLINETHSNPGLREKLLASPKEVIEEKLNFRIPDDFEIAVHEDTPMKMNIVLPVSSEELTEIDLAAVSGAGCYTYVPQCDHGDCPLALD